MQLILFALFMTVIPLLLGALLTRDMRNTPYELLAMWCFGWVIMLAALYVPAVICVLLHRSLTELTILYLSVLTVLLACSVRTLIRDKVSFPVPARNYIRGISLTEILAFLPVVFHAVVVFRMMHVDDDDFAYVAAATTSLDTNTLMMIQGGTGKPITDYAVDGANRLVSSPEFTFFAIFSKLTGTRPAALCHTYLPPFLTILFFAVLFLVGYELFDGDRAKTGLFVLFAFVISASSYYSKAAAANFPMIRSWQGKSQVIGLIMPLILLVYFSVIRTGKFGLREMITVAVLFTAACLMTSMGAMLTVLEAGALSLVTAFILKDKKVFLLSLVPMVIPAVTAVIYLTV